MNFAYRTFTLVFLLLCLGPACSAYAQSADHDQARRALEQGGVLPFDQILETAQERAKGDSFLDAVSGPYRGRPAMEVFFVTPDGRVHSILVDARDASVIGKGGMLRGHIKKQDSRRPPPPPKRRGPAPNRGNKGGGPRR